MKLLALDIATKTGFAYGDITSDAPSSGSIRIAKKGASLGAYFFGYRFWLWEFLQNYKPELVVFEQPMAPSVMAGRTNMQTVRLLIGLCAVTEEICYNKVQVREAKVSDIRGHFLGARGHRRDMAKQMTKQRCKMLGWDAVDDNAADALALWSYQRSILLPHKAIVSMPLFIKQKSA